MTTTRQQVTVRGPDVVGYANAEDITAYLLANGWSPRGERFYGRGAGSDEMLVHAPGSSGIPLETVLRDISACERRTPGEILRDIEARVRQRAYLQANIGQMDRFLAELGANRIERIGFESQREKFAEEFRAMDAAEGRPDPNEATETVPDSEDPQADSLWLTVEQVAERYQLVMTPHRAMSLDLRDAVEVVLLIDGVRYTARRDGPELAEPWCTWRSGGAMRHAGLPEALEDLRARAAGRRTAPLGALADETWGSMEPR
jgi:hypothetical protein